MRDLVTWEDVSARMHFADEGTARRMRHGTVIEVATELVASLAPALRAKARFGTGGVCPRAARE